MQFDPDSLDDAKEKMEWLAITWLAVLDRADIPDKHLYALNPAISSKVIYHYVQDLRFLKLRYRINDEVQAPKMAGLMANAILKYRPLVPVDGWQLGIEENYVNEFLAIYHGICVCASHKKPTYGNKAMAALVRKPNFGQWLSRFIFHIRERNYTAESLVMAFETLCLAAFHENLDGNQHIA